MLILNEKQTKRLAVIEWPLNAWKEFAHDFIEVLNRVENGHQATHDTPH